MKPITIKTVLEDVYGEKKDLKVKLVTSPLGISIYVEGYGNDSMEPGHGAVVHIENCDGKFRIDAFTDRENEEPTHTLEFEGARDIKESVENEMPKL